MRARLGVPAFKELVNRGVKKRVAPPPALTPSASQPPSLGPDFLPGPNSHIWKPAVLASPGPGPGHAQAAPQERQLELRIIRQINNIFNIDSMLPRIQVLLIEGRAIHLHPVQEWRGDIEIKIFGTKVC